MSYLFKNTYLRTLRNKLLREANEESPPPTERLPQLQTFNPSESDIAFVYKLDSNSGVGVAYSPKAIIDGMEKINAREEVQSLVRKDMEKIIFNSILGYIRIKKAPMGCNGAWEVKSSAAKNKGLGKLVYGMGYHMSAEAGSGFLMPDREALSDKAREAWRKVRKKSAGKTLDNIKHPQEYAFVQKHLDNPFNHDPFHDKYHTEETSDDCITWPVAKNDPGGMAEVEIGVEDEETQDAVNRAYAMGDMGYDFGTMNSIHNQMIDFMAKNYNFLPKTASDGQKYEYVEKLLINVGKEFFFTVM